MVFGNAHGPSVSSDSERPVSEPISPTAGDGSQAAQGTNEAGEEKGPNLLYHIGKFITWMPRRCRYDADNPPRFSLALNLLFALVSSIPALCQRRNYQLTGVKATTFTVANLYYVQPILFKIADTFDVGFERASSVATLLQAGYACGLLLLCPLGDIFRRRHYILALVAFTATLVSTTRTSHSSTHGNSDIWSPVARTMSNTKLRDVRGRILRLRHDNCNTTAHATSGGRPRPGTPKSNFPLARSIRAFTGHAGCSSFVRSNCQLHGLEKHLLVCIRGAMVHFHPFIPLHARFSIQESWRTGLVSDDVEYPPDVLYRAIVGAGLSHQLHYELHLHFVLDHVVLLALVAAFRIFFPRYWPLLPHRNIHHLLGPGIQSLYHR